MRVTTAHCFLERVLFPITVHSTEKPAMPNQAVNPDIETLARRLAEVEESGEVPEGSTLDVLRADLDSLEMQLRAPVQREPYEDESACERALVAVRRIGRDPSFSTVRRAEESLIEVAAEFESPKTGQKLGQYRLLEHVGLGGMGTVYKALHVKLEKVVALKVLPADRLRDPQAVWRFEREMRAVGKLQHPNIVAAHDAGEIDGTHFLVMELVDGEDVAELVRRRGPLPVHEACDIIRQAALGLQHAHEHGLVHRDIKPSNLIVSAGASTFQAGADTGDPPQVKVLDLGLALLHEAQQGASHEVTSTGQIVGTVDYMAPEQGADTHGVDIRADIYSLGATLYKLLTGRAPFETSEFGSVIAKLAALASTAPEQVRSLRPEVPVELARIVHRMLGKQPRDRYATPIEVAQALEPFARRPAKSLVSPANEETAGIVQTGTASTVVVEKPQAPDHEPTHAGPARSASHGPPRSRKWMFAGGLAGVLLAVAVFRFVTRDGTIVVQLRDAQDVEVHVDGQSSAIAATSDDGRKLKVSIAPGERTISVFTTDGTELSTSVGREPVRIRAGKECEIEAWLEKPAKPQTADTPVPPPENDEDSERQVAEWVLQRGGTLSLNSGDLQASIPEELPVEPFRVLHVFLTGVPDLHGSELSALQQLTSPKLLSLEGSGVTDDDLESVARLTTLRDISLFGCERIDGSGIAQLMSLPFLRSLQLGRTAITDDALVTINEFPALERLGVSDSAVTDTGLSHVADSPTLKALAIANTGITGDDLQLLHLRSSQWEELALSGDQVSPAGAMHLHNLAALRQLLVVNHCDLGLIKPLTSITDLRIKGGFGTQDVAVLSEFRHLKSLHIRYAQFTEEDVQTLRDALPECRIESDFGTFEPTVVDATAN